MLSILCGRASAAIENGRLYRELQGTFKQTIQVLANLLEDKDPYTRGHSDRVSQYSRLIAEERGFGGLTADELVHGVPHARFINASFAYAKPREPNRFNPANRGAWYAALDVETCIAEVGHHLTQALADAGDFDAVVEYGEMIASMAGVFIDLREQPGHPALDPDKTKGYPVGNALAAQARAAGHNGIIYPSVRHADGTCIAALWPNVVQSVAQGAMYRLTWSGNPDYSREAI